MKRLRLMSAALSISCSIGVLMAIIVTGNQDSLPRTAVSVPTQKPAQLQRVAGLPTKFPVQRRALQLPAGVDPITTSSVRSPKAKKKRLDINSVISQGNDQENPYPGDGGTVTVHSGDTLFGIARRTGVNAHKLAKINALDAPYVIRPGQILRLSSDG